MNLAEVKVDIRKFWCKLRLIEYFSDRQETESIDIVKPKSTFTLPKKQIPSSGHIYRFSYKIPFRRTCRKTVNS